jgi:hypothetical protein
MHALQKITDYFTSCETDEMQFYAESAQHREFKNNEHFSKLKDIY